MKMDADNIVVHSGESHGYQHILDLLNNIITIMFVAEAGVKVIGWGPRAYIADHWYASMAFAWHELIWL